MYDFILQTILFVSLGAVIYLMARAVPRVNDAGETVHTMGAFDRFLSRLPLREVDERLNSYSEKFLRRLRVFTLRFDNTLNQKLEKLKKANGRNGEGNAAGGDLFTKGNGDKKE